MPRRRGTNGTRNGGTRRTRGGGGGDHLDQLLNDDRGDQDDTRDDDLDDAADDQDTDDDGVDDQDDSDLDDDTDDQDDPPLTRADLEREAQRIADRTVNAVLREIRGARRQGDRGNQRGGRDQRRDRDDDRGAADSGPDPADLREARLAFREYLGDQYRPGTPTEREIAAELGGALIREHLVTGGGDPDRAARTAADTVANRLRAHRRAIERQTVAALRKRGALRDDYGSGSQNGGAPAVSLPAGRAPAPARTADLRKQALTLAEEFNAQNGHQKPAGQVAG
ncbi:hypothetical protein ACFXGA_06155 [Actinosynnema sp. NPDC059335]|uniref:hypothetical protein n=1 Tax=Actinosynnema sp. NPDC059335 TaxID=3346804 RepID=UPI003671EB30